MLHIQIIHEIPCGYDGQHISSKLLHPPENQFCINFAIFISFLKIHLFLRKSYNFFNDMNWRPNYSVLIYVLLCLSYLNYRKLPKVPEQEQKFTFQLSTDRVGLQYSKNFSPALMVHLRVCKAICRYNKAFLMLIYLTLTLNCIHSRSPDGQLFNTTEDATHIFAPSINQLVLRPTINNPGPHPTIHNYGPRPKINPGPRPTIDNPGPRPTGPRSTINNPGPRPTINPGRRPTINPGPRPTINKSGQGPTTTPRLANSAPLPVHVTRTPIINTQAHRPWPAIKPGPQTALHNPEPPLAINQPRPRLVNQIVQPSPIY